MGHLLGPVNHDYTCPICGAQFRVQTANKWAYKKNVLRERLLFCSYECNRKANAPEAQNFLRIYSRKQTERKKEAGQN